MIPVVGRVSRVFLSRCGLGSEDVNWVLLVKLDISV